MLPLKPPSTAENLAASLLEENPLLSQALLADCNNDFGKVTTFLEPILKAPRQGEITPFYIQAVTTGRTTFLIANVGQVPSLQLIGSASSWLIGRSSRCAIAIPDKAISRQHAGIGHNFGQDFYLTDVGSSNGTWVNCHRLEMLERYPLRDGDLLKLGPIQIEFFITGVEKSTPNAREAITTEACR